MIDRTRKIVEKARILDSLKQEFEQTLDQRVNRYFEVKPHDIIPNSHFAAVSAECYLLYRDGHYYGAISLSQSVAEALVKFLCNKNGWKPKKDFEKNLTDLRKRNVLTNDLYKMFVKIWDHRNDYHHLNPQIEQDRKKLATLAKEKLTDLRDIEKEIFAFSSSSKGLVPKYRKYWDQSKNTIPVFLRLD